MRGWIGNSLIVLGAIIMAWMASALIKVYSWQLVSEGVSLHDAQLLTIDWPAVVLTSTAVILLISGGLVFRRKNRTSE
jgi:hypothetical protein